MNSDQRTSDIIAWKKSLQVGIGSSTRDLSGQRSSSPVGIEVVKNFGGFLVAQTIEAQLPQGASEVPARDTAAPVSVQRLERSQCRRSPLDAVAFSCCCFAAHEPPQLGPNVVKDVP